MTKTIFLTGASGFLGKYLVRDLQARGNKIIGLIRPDSLAKVIDDPAYQNVTWVKGTLDTLADSLSAEDRKVLAATTDIVHAAAVYDLAQSEAQMYPSNVTGTHELVRLANTLPNVATFHHVSTLAVAGDNVNEFGEDEFDEGQCFPDGYSATKFAAESCVRYSDTKYAKTIYRLGILIGDTSSGWIPKIDGLYYVLLFLLKNKTKVRALLSKVKVLPFPFASGSRTYLVPVDIASKAITASVEQARNQGAKTGDDVTTYHVVGEGQNIRDVISSMVKFLGISVKLMPVPQNSLNDVIVEKLGVPKEALHYLYEAPKLSSSRFRKDFPDFKFPRFEDYSDQLYRFAQEKWQPGRNA